MSDVTVRLNQLICIFVGFLIFLISLYISHLYTEGDQVAYHEAYTAMSGLSFGDDWNDISKIYNQNVTSAEWGHIIVSMIGGGLGIEKNLLISLLNGVLAVYAVRLLLAWDASYWIAIGLPLTNYYFYVLYFSAERAKLAFLFLVFSLLSKRKILIAACVLGSIFSHLSFGFIYAGIIFNRLAMQESIARVGTVMMTGALLLLLIMIPSGFLEYSMVKIRYYWIWNEHVSISDFLPAILLLFISFFYADDKMKPLMMSSPVPIGIAVIGGNRLNMLYFFIVTFFALQAKSGMNAGLIGLMFYFCYKTIIFLWTIINFKHGWPSNEF